MLYLNLTFNCKNKILEYRITVFLCKNSSLLITHYIYIYFVEIFRTLLIKNNFSQVQKGNLNFFHVHNTNPLFHQVHKQTVGSLSALDPKSLLLPIQDFFYKVDH